MLQGQHAQQEHSFLLERGADGVERAESGAEVPRLEAKVHQGASWGLETGGWKGPYGLPRWQELPEVGVRQRWGLGYGRKDH